LKSKLPKKVQNQNAAASVASKIILLVKAAIEVAFGPKERRMKKRRGSRWWRRKEKKEDGRPWVKKKKTVW